MEKREFEAVLPNLEDMILFIINFTGEKSTKKDKYKLRLIAEEILVNIINYGFEKEIGKIEITCNWIEKNLLEVSITDNGKQFNPLEKEEPDINKPIEEKEIGGLGIFMIKKLVDNINYDYKNKKNILTFRKKIEF